MNKSQLTNAPNIIDDVLIGELIVENNCIKLNDNYYYIKIDNLRKDDLYLNQRLIPNTELKKQTNGVYVYIIGSIRDELNLISVKVLTINEIGTKHRDIFKRLHGIYFDKIHYSGEFIKTGNTIQYNFVSGSYMAGNVDFKNPGEEHIRNVDSVFSSLGFNPSFSSETLVNNETLILTIDNLQELLRYGAEIFEFKTKAHCKANENYKFLTLSHKMKYDSSVRAWEAGVKKYNSKLPKPIYVELPIPPNGKAVELAKKQKQTENVGSKRKREKNVKKSIDGNRTTKRRRKNQSI
jgi:hypothetical protein